MDFQLASEKNWDRACAQASIGKYCGPLPAGKREYVCRNRACGARGSSALQLTNHVAQSVVPHVMCSWERAETLRAVLPLPRANRSQSRGKYEATTSARRQQQSAAAAPSQSACQLSSRPARHGLQRDTAGGLQLRVLTWQL